MGSTSSSSNSNSSRTEQYDERISATDSAVVLRLDSGANIDINDPGAFTLVRDLGGRFVEAYEGMFADSIGLMQQQADGDKEQFQQMVDGLKSEAAQGVDKIIKAGTVIAVGFLAAKYGPDLVKSFKR